MNDYRLRFRAARHAKGLTYKRLSERSGVSTTTLVEFERGRREISLVVADLVASGLGMTLVEVLSTPPEYEEE